MKVEEIRAKILELTRLYAETVTVSENFVAGETAVPPSGKLIMGTEIINLVDSSLEAWLTAGRFNRKFEEQLASYWGLKYAMTVNSGSSANLVALSSLTSRRLGDKAIMPGDEIITVAAGFPTTVNPILQVGAVPVFVDIALPTYNINIEALEQALSKKTKAVMIAHTLGNPFNASAVFQFCKKYDLWLVEDCCDALGSLYNGAHVGTFGDISTVSFYPAHHITMGEGGAVLTNSADLKSIAESIRDWGRDCYCPPGKDNTCGKRFQWKLGELPPGYDHKYTYSHVGYNLKITDMQAACGLGQLEHLDFFIKKRRENHQSLFNLLSDYSEQLILPEATPGSLPSWFGFAITLRKNSAFPRNEVVDFLNQEKIGTRLLFGGNLTKQPYMLEKKFRKIGDLEVTNFVMNNTFWVGIHPALSDEHIAYTADRIKTALGVNF